MVYLGTTPRPDLEQLALEEGAVLVFVSAVVGAGGPMWSPGRLRNAGIIAARSDWIYLSDADTFPRDRSFLLELAQRVVHSANKREARVQPKICRVFDLDGSFLHYALTGVDVEAADTLDHCFQLCVSGVTRPLALPEIRITLDGTSCACTSEEFALLSRQSSPDNPLNQIVFRPDVHYGGIFAERTALLSVGGYHEAYRMWGCEDDDLISKLSQTVGCVPMVVPNASRPIIHIEHSRSYINENLQRNRLLLNDRKKSGLARMITVDRAALDALTAAMKGGSIEPRVA